MRGSYGVLDKMPVCHRGQAGTASELPHLNGGYAAHACWLVAPHVCMRCCIESAGHCTLAARAAWLPSQSPAGSPSNAGFAALLHPDGLTNSPACTPAAHPACLPSRPAGTPSSRPPGTGSPQWRPGLRSQSKPRTGTGLCRGSEGAGGSGGVLGSWRVLLQHVAGSRREKGGSAMLQAGLAPLETGNRHRPAFTVRAALSPAVQGQRAGGEEKPWGWGGEAVGCTHSDAADALRPPLTSRICT